MKDTLKTILLIAFSLLVVIAASGFIGYRYGAGKWQKIMAQADKAASEKLAELTAQTLQTERQLRDDLDSLTAKNRKEKQDAEKTINALRTDIRSGAVRLSVGTDTRSRSAFCADPGIGPDEARAELDAETAEALVTITADGDSAIRDLNHCIDAYERVRVTIKKPQPGQQ